ncbi:2-hydroxyglutaryl-CoA dehydratase [Synergistales bacterium]|nr:2-hydroxyglutaryl-CoA dehydratase [Synergistales bacterium]
MITLAVAGSGALGLAEGIDVQFTQELIACSASIGRYLPDVDVCVELGGEDAKLTFFDESGADQRMNETCAGGTGAFIDQMAALLGTDASGLNELAKSYKTIYPIASRCGVFAKTDIQPLLNDGAAKPDIAASIFQAIVNQTISGLACGRRIKGNVAFLGGPLYFLPELRAGFTETLGLTPAQCVSPENPHLFVALGAAILGKKNGAVNLEALREKALRFFSSKRTSAINVLPVLFAGEGAKSRFQKRHSASAVARKPLNEYKGDAFLGIDVGSTTIKAALIGRDGELLFSKYRSAGKGEPLRRVREILRELYSAMPEDVRISRSGVTGYGEKLVQSALGLDLGEVETVAHARAAEFVLPGADFIIDIGGQDMKCLGIKGGVINRVYLNEACSSGCGSFIQSFAESLGLTMGEFADAAEASSMPVDLGTRCTVFMNSRVRQAQKDGASVNDISAGLAYSVARNALYKVLKMRDTDELGSRIVAQGGTFKNNALLRAFELMSGREVVRPDIAELMGAFGAALLARDTFSGEKSTIITREALDSFGAETSTARCARCGNRCILTKTLFSDGRSYLSGNRCERGAPAERTSVPPPNVADMKYKRLFDYYKPIPEKDAPRGVIGIPRALNMYENYPLWFTFLSKLGYSVRLSSASPASGLGMDTIPSQTLCYPAKLVHSHITDLLRSGVKRIFYPVILKERGELKNTDNHFNCPVVTGYPDVAYLNIDEARDNTEGGERGIDFTRAPLPIDSPKRLTENLFELMSGSGVTKSEIKSAVAAAYEEMRRFKEDIAEYGRTALEAVKNGATGIVLAGHPYHLDPEVNHGIPTLINSYGVAVLTEDSILDTAAENKDELYVVDQWEYHSRLYKAASIVANHPDFKEVQMVQLNSFGCGLDAISADQAAAILERGGKPHTLIKIDEGSNNGAVRIRIRSLLAAMRSNRTSGEQGKLLAPQIRPTTKYVGKLCGKSKARRTILCPPLSPYHFQFLEAAMRSEGFDFRVLPEGSREAIELALKYVNNDACYPAMVVVGQFLSALSSGEYDPDKTDCLYVQTGGPCRASNYVPLLRRALDAAGYKSTRVIAVNSQGRGEAAKLPATPSAMWKCLMGAMYGDLLMRLTLRTRPYEKERGSVNELRDKWSERCKESVSLGGWRRYTSDIADMVKDFAALPIDDTRRPRVGIVGEILVKYHAGANERLVDIIEAEGGEAVVPDLVSFLLYSLYDPIYAHKRLSGKLMSRLAGHVGIAALNRMRRPIERALEGTRFGECHDIYGMAEDAAGILSPANQGGEGWLLTAEMMKLIKSGVKNILCVQPFACLPNHITGKGVMKELKRRNSGVNILPLDYDASASSANRLNRIKLLMAAASA